MNEGLGFFTEEYQVSETETISLTFEGSNLTTHMLFTQEDPSGESLMKGLLMLLTPDSKKRLHKVTFEDFNFETETMMPLDLTPAEKLMKLVGGSWACVELMLYLRFGNKERAEKMTKRLQSSDPDIEALKKKVTTNP